MTDRIAEEDLAAHIGQRVLNDAYKLRTMLPDCFARFSLKRGGHEYEIRVIYYGKADAA